ncbi:MAG: hypothetical protein CMQ43_10300 [Gammaproteobacteria bacterium]|nr:hypothetical protein [Gammaproteobacteria bacterium]
MNRRFRFPATLRFDRLDRNVLTAVLGLGLAASALAGDGRPEFPLSVAEARDRAEARFQTLDADRSGEVSPAEFEAAAPEPGDHRFPGAAFHHPRQADEWRRAAAARRAEQDPAAESPDDLEAALFDRLDTNADGLLSRDEFTAERLRAARRAAVQSRIFAHLDADGSGGLSRDELPDPSRWLEAMDSDGDGTVTREEARAHRQSHGKRSG